ncbi:MAG: hypothetical protein JWL63_3538 [Rhodocyclales bacterium]|nr:hypothetical protein [Rhodocyclales bacterium]
MQQTRHTLSEKLLATFFVVGGTLHFIFPRTYAHIIPPWIPQPLLMVWISGVCEIAGGLGVLQARLQRAAGYGLIVLSLAVFPANVQMFLNAHAADHSIAAQALLLLRLPLQIPLIYWIWRTTVMRPSDTPMPALQRMRP